MSTGHNIILENCISRNEPFDAIKVIYCGVGGSRASDRIKLSLSMVSAFTGFKITLIFIVLSELRKLNT